MLIRLAKAWFGDFNKQELKKFFLLGLVFGFIIGIYWTLRSAKDAVFLSIVGGEYLGIAKIVSLIYLLPIVLLYSKMLDKFNRHKILYVLSLIYGVCTIIFGLFLLHPIIGLPNTNLSPYRLIGWAWYVFVESYGSLMAAAFWAFATDTTDAGGAKKGFPFVVLIAQTISILGPLFLTPLAKPSYFGSSAYVILLCGSCMFIVLFLVMLFMNTIPASQMIGYKPTQKEEKLHAPKPGFLEGLRLLISQPYLLGIFSIIAIYEMIVTIIDFNFKNLVGQTMLTEVSRIGYLGEYAVWVNVISSICLLLGVGNIQRRLGLKVSLMIMPFIIGLAIWMFFFYPIVHVLFWIMVGVKALNYAINSPSLKQLYVPTSHDAKYKSQAWIETFGSRGSKASGSMINILKSPFINWFGPQMGLQAYLLMSVSLSTGFLVVWLFIAVYLARTFNDAIDNKKVVC